MDDSKDKIRRNLIAVSCVVIAAVFFGVEIKPDATLFGLAKGEHVTPWRLWAAALVILCYFFLRFHFDAETENLGERFRKELDGLASPRVARYLAIRLSRDLLERGNSTLLLDDAFKEQFSNPTQPASKGFADADRSKWPIKVALRIVKSESLGVRGICHFTREVEWVGGAKSISAGGFGAHYELPGHVWFHIRVRAYLHVLLYSKTGIDLLVPYGLAIAAVVVALIQLMLASIATLVPFGC